MNGEVPFLEGSKDLFPGPLLVLIHLVLELLSLFDVLLLCLLKRILKSLLEILLHKLLPGGQLLNLLFKLSLLLGMLVL